MSGDEPIVLRLEVDRDVEPITGTLTEPGHPGRRFAGWLGLTNEIESIRSAHLQTESSEDQGLSHDHS